MSPEPLQQEHLDRRAAGRGAGSRQMSTDRQRCAAHERRARVGEGGVEVDRLGRAGKGRYAER